MASTAKKQKVEGEENQRSVDEKESEALEAIDNFQGEVRKKVSNLLWLVSLLYKYIVWAQQKCFLAHFTWKILQMPNHEPDIWSLDDSSMILLTHSDFCMASLLKRRLFLVYTLMFGRAWTCICVPCVIYNWPSIATKTIFLEKFRLLMLYINWRLCILFCHFS